MHKCAGMGGSPVTRMAFKRENTSRKFDLPEPFGPMSMFKALKFRFSMDAMLLKPFTVM